MAVTAAQGLTFLNGGGDMGALMRTKDWSQSPLGTPDTWPPALRMAISILLNSKFPMFVWWGPELLTFYNDAYREIAGAKHPQALGASGKDVWAEIWPVVGPLAHQVLTEGTSTWAEDQLLYINRTGTLEETYFTFSYSPVFNESGQPSGVFCACTETTEKVLGARRKQEIERNLRNTILQAPVAMCILQGTSFVVEIANERMYELWGRGAEALLQKPIFEGLPEAKEQGLEELLLQVYHTGETFSASERLLTLPRNGAPEQVYLNFVYQPFREGGQEITGIMAVAVEVTEQVLARKKIEESEQELQRRVVERTAELEKINNELKRSNINLEEFAYAASHDLKEPVRKIHFFSDRLKTELADKLNESQSRLFNRMEQATLRMRSLIDDLLAYSHVSRGMTHETQVNLNEKVKLVLEDLELEIQQKEAIIQVGQLPVVMGNRRQFQQLFQNLIGNALKYSRQGVPPQITLSAKKVTGKETLLPLSGEAADKTYHLIEIADNGIGFDQGDAERIFNVFTRLHGNVEYKGTGVGLSIARKVVENHGGYIWADSQPGEGTTFKVLLPVTTEAHL